MFHRMGFRGGQGRDDRHVEADAAGLWMLAGLSLGFLAIAGIVKLAVWLAGGAA